MTIRRDPNRTRANAIHLLCFSKYSRNGEGFEAGAGAATGAGSVSFARRIADFFPTLSTLALLQKLAMQPANYLQWWFIE